MTGRVIYMSKEGNETDRSGHRVRMAGIGGCRGRQKRGRRNVFKKSAIARLNRAYLDSKKVYDRPKLDLIRRRLNVVHFLQIRDASHTRKLTKQC